MVQRLSIIFPVGQGRFRAYVVFRHDLHRPLRSAEDEAQFIELSVATGASPAWFAPGAVIGPLASFNAPDTWVERPYRDGVVLVGDAAAASDPSFGCGLSLTLHDVRVLRDRLLETDDWGAAADAYAPSTISMPKTCAVSTAGSASCSTASGRKQTRCEHALCRVSLRTPRALSISLAADQKRRAMRLRAGASLGRTNKRLI